MNMDEAILKAFPLVAIPRSGRLPETEQAGMRYLAGSSGLWRELTLPWLRAITRVAHCEGVVLPYGDVGASIDIRCGTIPHGLIRRFLFEAREAAPVEMAAALVWTEADGSWRYERRRTRSASVAHIDYDEIRLQEGEHLVVDMHSHGDMPAFFSGEDDRDDAGAMRFSVVVGNIGSETPSSQMRLCLAGVFLRASINEHGTLEVRA